MGHGSTTTTCTMDNFERVLSLTYDISRMLDVLVFDVVVDEGEYQ